MLFPIPYFALRLDCAVEGVLGVQRGSEAGGGSGDGAADEHLRKMVNPYSAKRMGSLIYFRICFNLLSLRKFSNLPSTSPFLSR